MCFIVLNIEISWWGLILMIFTNWTIGKIRNSSWSIRELRPRANHYHPNWKDSQVGTENQSLWEQGPGADTQETRCGGRIWVITDKLLEVLCGQVWWIKTAERPCHRETPQHCESYLQEPCQVPRQAPAWTSRGGGERNHLETAQGLSPA